MAGSAAGRRVLVAAFGSSGDVFPLVPLIERLVAEGHDVRCALPRSLGLYVRARGIPVYGLGGGAELRIFADADTITTRFGGWASWRDTMARYVAPGLRADVARLEEALAEWRPDLVVTGSFSAAARVAAHRCRVPRLDVSIYPQKVDRLGACRSFGLALRRAVAELCGAPGDPSANGADGLVGELAWGASRGTVVLHDRALLGPRSGPAEVVGFPYWDAGPQRAEDGERVDRFLDGPGPVVAVTLGSFLGAHQRAPWREAVAAVDELGVRALLVGPQGRGRDGELDAGSGVLAVGFVSMSRVAGRVDAVVHHGGVGTMFGVLRAGRAAVVLPQAFDQSFNAGLVEAAGVGVDGSGGRVADALARVLDEPGYAARARRLAGELVASETATDQLVQRVTAASV